MDAGSLPGDGRGAVLGGVRLPAGRRVVVAGDPDRPVAWVTRCPVAEPGLVWSALYDAAPGTGLVPVLVGGVGDDDGDDFGFEACDLAEVDRLDAGMVLSARWRGKMPSDLDEKYAPEGVSYFDAFAPFSRQFPGLAPPAGESLSAGALRQVLQDYPAVRIALIPARRGADVLPLAGWNSGDDYRDYEPYEQVAPAVWVAAVVRSWEDRFGVRLLHVTGAEIRLLVQRPPVTREHAELVAAEHFAFADECDGCGSVSYVSNITPALVSAPIWQFWWD